MPDTYDPNRIFHNLEEAAEADAQASYEADLLEELKKARLAELTLDHLKDCKSRVDAETRALADPQWKEYIQGMVAARRKANRAKAKYHNVRALASARQTEESSRRALTR